MPVANAGKPTARTRSVPPVAETVGNPDYVAPRPIKEGSQDKPDSGSGYRPGKYVEAVEQFYILGSVILMPFAPKTAMSIVTEDDEGKSVALECAEGWDQLAKTSPKVRKFLDGMSGGGTAIGLAMAHLPILGSAANELGLFSQIGKLFNRKKAEPAPAPNPATVYNPEFGRQFA